MFANFYVVIKHSYISFKVAVGSVPPNYNPKLLESEEKPWKKENFEITFLQRVQSTASSRFSEQRFVVSCRLRRTISVDTPISLNSLLRTHHEHYHILEMEF
jgi:hypothetical protein